MKVLFLDVDGVLNGRADFDPSSDKYKQSGGYVINDSLVAHVQRIVAETGCSVVLSSSWRLDPKGRDAVAQHFTLHDITPDKRGLTDRGCEVIAWLEQHPEVKVHAILDDNSDFHKDQPLFLTDWETGITDEVARAVIEHLGVQ